MFMTDINEKLLDISERDKTISTEHKKIKVKPFQGAFKSSKKLSLLRKTKQCCFLVHKDVYKVSSLGLLAATD